MLGNTVEKLGKPPVVEAWIEFRFAVGEESPEWDAALAEAFLRRNFGESFKVNSYVGHTEFTVEPGKGGPSLREAKVLLERARAANQAEDRYVQVGRDVLIYNLLRKQDVWPEYSVLLREAMEAYGKYVADVRPKALLRTALHYRDVVSIPFGTGSDIDLGEYLSIYPEVPRDRFGPVTSFLMMFTLPLNSRSGILNLVIRNEPMAVGADGKPIPGARFRMDWHLTTDGIRSTDPVPVQDWLDSAHRDILKAFRNGFTEKGWALFDPKEG